MECTLNVRVIHVLWECPACSSCRLEFLGEKLQEILGDGYIVTLIYLVT